MKKFNVKKLFSVAGMCLHIFWGIVFTAFAACFYMFRGIDADVMDIFSILFLVAIVEAMMAYLLWFSLREALMSEFTELRLLMLALSTISFGMLFFGVPGCFVHSVNLDPVWYGSLGLTFILIIAGVIDARRHIRRDERYWR